MTNEYQILISKLDAFIRKFYLNRIIRGILLSFLIVIFYNLVIFSIEYFSYLSVLVRSVIFYFSVFLFFLIFAFYIVIPLLKYFKIGKILPYKEASRIIASHFSTVEDKLINILELASTNESDLVLASIDQKINDLKPLPFLRAVNFKSNLKYAKYYLGLFLIVSLILFFYPSVIVEGASRIINHSQVFIPKAPFNFTILNDSLRVPRGGKLSLMLRIDGNTVPSEVEIEYGNYTFFMLKNQKNVFSYDFENINNSLDFKFKAGEFYSEKYAISVIPLPQIFQFEISADVPEYTKIKDFSQSNIGDITIPEGTSLSWKFNTQDAASMLFYFNDSIKNELNRNNNTFTTTMSFKKTSVYSISAKNEFISSEDIVKYRISVIPDLFPEISVISVIDSSNLQLFYFKGYIQDDYGFNSLTFNYFSSSDKKNVNKLVIPLNVALTQQEFYYSFDFSNLKVDDDIEYYFEVFDNDKINGSKSVKSGIYKFSIPTDEEIAKLKDELSNKLNNSLSSSKSLSNEIQKDIDDFRNKLIQEKISDWEAKEILKDIKEKHDDLKKALEKANEINKEKDNFSNTFSEQDQQIIDKQKQIEELLEKLMDSELEGLMKELQKLMEDFNKRDFFQLSEDMKTSYDDLSKQLDKDLEMLKRFEVEQNVNNIADKLRELAEKQKELSEKLDGKNKEENSQKIDSLNKEISKIQEEYKQALEKNESLDEPYTLEKFEEEFNNIKQTSSESKQQSSDGKNKKSSESMKKASEQSESLAEQMDAMMQANMQQQAMEDIDNLRQILDNLITFSFQQEELIDELKTFKGSDPRIAQSSVKQNNLRDNFEIINDSLLALSSRVPAISSTINHEVLTIKKELDKSIKSLENSARSETIVRQQNIMTSTNNLALLLSEIVSQMQQQAAQKMSGKQQCQNPSSGPGSKPSLSQMKEMQQSMKQQLQQMLKQMKDNGANPGGQKSQMNKQFGQMLAKQQMYKEMLSKMMNGQSFSPETMQQLKEIQQLIDKNEQDIMNKNITPQTLYRQDQILTRLLESEKAERERDLDEKRKSEEAKEIFSNPQKYFENISEEKLKFNDRLNWSNLKLNTFYRKKYDQYLLDINNNE